MMQPMLRKYHLIPLLAIIVLSACSSTPQPPNPDGPILTGFDALPKALATLYLSPTPDNSQSVVTPTDAPPTDTPAPPTATLTPTAYVGVFLGAQTLPAIDGTFEWLPTHSPRIIISTARPGFHPTAAAIAGNFTAFGTPPGVISAIPSGLVPINSPPHPCSIAPGAPFANAYTRTSLVAQRLGCPLAAAYSLTLVTESFQSGVMFWRETKEIYALSTGAISKGAAQDIFWRVADTWTDALPASDPSLKPPAGTNQPMRGFGYAWRNNGQIRSGLGWALSGEQQYSGFWQDFEHGFMLTGNGNSVYALSPGDGPPVTTGVHFGALPQ